MPSKIQFPILSNNTREILSSLFVTNDSVTKETGTSIDNSEMKLLMNNENHIRNYKKQIRIGDKRPSNTLKNCPGKCPKTCSDFCDNFNDDSGFDFDSPNSCLSQISIGDNINANVPKFKKNEPNKDADYAVNNLFYHKSSKDAMLNNFMPHSTSSIMHPPTFRVNSATNAISNPKSVHKICNTTKKISSQMVTLNSQLGSISSNGKVQLIIENQPENQHRARYQTEGSRGAVKDRTGNGYPTVKLVGYTKATVLQIFIGTDSGRVAPHMFYQACRVTGKNSTACSETKQNGTVIIEIKIDENDDKAIVCDCVGILKERNVDVEQRFPEQTLPRSKKKSTHCRMVFRTTIVNDDNTVETLQICSQPIVCTQPPGVPEISKQSLAYSECTGGNEMFIIGKNFSKECKIIFQDVVENKIPWKPSISPDKEYFHQTHLICIVPPYWKQDIRESIKVQFYVQSNGKSSDPHYLTYIPSISSRSIDNDPVRKKMLLTKMLWNPQVDLVPNTTSTDDTARTLSSTTCSLSRTSSNSNLNYVCQNVDNSTNNVDILKEKNSSKTTSCLDNNNQRINKTDNMLLNQDSQTENNNNAATLDDYMQNSVVKTKLIKMNEEMENSLSSMQAPSYELLQQFVVTESSNVPLPAHSGPGIENYFSHLATSNSDLSNLLISKNLNAVMNSVNNVTNSNSFFPPPGPQSFFPIIDESQLKSRNPNEDNNVFSKTSVMHNDPMQTTTDTILLSNILHGTSESNRQSNSSSNRNLLTDSVSSNIVLIGTQPPMLSLNNNTIVTSTPLLDTNSNNILLSTPTTETSTTHDELILTNTSEMNTDSKNMQALLNNFLKSGDSMNETQTSHNNSQPQFIPYTTTSSAMLDLVNNNAIPDSLVTVQDNENNITVIKKEPEHMLDNHLNHMSNNDFLGYININTNCYR